MERSTALVPVLALGTKATSAASAPTNLARLAGRLAQRARQLEEEEARRLRFHALAPAILLGPHGQRRRAIGAMVDGQEAGIEAPLMANGGTEGERQCGHAMKPTP